ncbi:hypothetical protein ACPV38_17670 [Photobacterium damselae]|uniref:hypothetical protein n=1 Tax=Photobacterium damselae TaxID=38293 RepID=UPI004067A6B5
MNSIVFVCNYFPPEEHVGVRRVSFWVNYFSGLGYKVTVVTTSKKQSEKLYHFIDKRVNVYEYGYFKINKVPFVEVDRDNNNLVVQETNFVSKLKKIKRKYINPIFGQVLDFRIIPIIFQMVKIKFGGDKEIINEIFRNSVVISTSPPWVSHIFAIFLSKRSQSKLIIDYRDPFSNNYMFSSKFCWLETFIDKYICRSADVVTTVSESWLNYYKEFNDNTILIRNGFDLNMFEKDVPITIKSDRVINLSYFGSIEHPLRIPRTLMDFLEKTKKNIKINFYGSCSLIEDIVNRSSSLSDKVILHGPKSYDECIRIMKSSEINFVSESVVFNTWSSRGLIPTKIYEYIASGRPIIAELDPYSDAAKILRQSGLLLAPILVDPDYEKIFDDLDLNNFKIKKDNNFIYSLSRQSSTNILEKIINE